MSAVVERKKRILFVGEASFLSTGFSTYYRELLPRLVETGKYEIAEIGSYAARNHPLIEEFIQGRWKFYGVMPINEHERAIFNQPSQHPRDRGQNINQFGANVFDRAVAEFEPDIVVDIRDNWMLCVTGSTSIICSDVVKDIQDVEVGDKVLTDKGFIQNVTDTYVRNYSGIVHKFKLKQVGIPIEVTDDHPMLIAPASVSRDGLHYPDWHKVVPEWTASHHVKEGDFATFPIPKHTSDLQIDRSIARLLGYYAAEGCMIYEGKKADGKLKGVQFAFHKEEYTFVSDVVNTIKIHFNIDCKIKYVNNAAVVRAFGKSIAEFVAQYVTGLAKTKRICHDLVFADKQIVAEFLCGLLRGDGGFDESRGYYCTASKTLAYQTFLMCLKVGMVPSWNRNKNGNFSRYVFSFGHKNTFKGFQEVYNEGSVPEDRDYHKSNDDYVFLKVRNITRKEVQSEPVYNLEVENDHSYVSSCVLHNCWQLRSPFRKWFKLLWMPTVDAEPQQEEWIQDYEQADLIACYSDYGIDTLRRQSLKKMKIFPIPLRPGVDLETFKPMDRKQVREDFCINEDIPIIGTVMRNQSRKLFPDLIDAFSLMKKKFKGEEMVDKAILMIHSAWPDNQFSYDYPRHVMRLHSYDWMEYSHKGVKDSVMQSLMCHKCNKKSLAYAINLCNRPIEKGLIHLPCMFCGENTATCPTTGYGYSREDLAKLYNLMDLYVQCTICEGDGMPIQEAKACGVPTLVMDYTAMREKGRRPEYKHLESESDYSCHKGGETIDVGRYYHEPETSCKRALPDIEDLAQKMRDLITDRKRLKKMGDEARECVETNYDWNQLFKNWEYILDNVTPKDRTNTWDSPINVMSEAGRPEVPANLSDEQYVEWLYLNVLKYPKIDPEGARMWIQYLVQGADRQLLYDQFVQIANQQVDDGNARERIRAQVAEARGEKVERPAEETEWM